MKTEKLHRVRDVERILDLSGTHIRLLIQKGELDAVRVGPRGLRVTESSLQAFIEARKDRVR